MPCIIAFKSSLLACSGEGGCMQVWVEEELLHEGAEAIVHSGRWMGRPAVRKHRRGRAWRHPDLDDRLVSTRLSMEARLLLQMQGRGLACPALYDIDIAGGTIVMQRIAGETLVDVLRDDPSGVDIESVFTALGRALRDLHRNRIGHGDVTTSNIILQPDGEPMLIDFGLGRLTFETEPFGLDLHVLHECIQASHPDIPDAMQHVITGYAEGDAMHGPPPPIEGGVLPSAAEVLDRFEQIKRRVRYHG